MNESHSLVAAALSSAPNTERIDKIQIVKEINAAIAIEIRTRTRRAERIDKIKVVEEIDGVVAVEIRATDCEGGVDAVRCAAGVGDTMSSVAKRLDVNYHTLREWVQAAKSAASESLIPKDISTER